MRPPRIYDAGHRMLVTRTGDPARGEWAPWTDRSETTKRGKRRRNPKQRQYTPPGRQERQ